MATRTSRHNHGFVASGHYGGQKVNINWFPGHMSKSMRMMSDDIKLVDAVIYVLDARAPYSCLNPEF